MRIVGICGSPKGEQSSTGYLLEQALEAAEEIMSDDNETVLLYIRDFNILHCTGCDSCVRRKPCPQSAKDDMPKLEKELVDADGIIIAAPSYFTSVPGILKDFMDRSRHMKMNGSKLKDTIFGAITHAGLKYGGQEHVIDVLNRYAIAQGMIVVGGTGSPVKDTTFGSGSLQTDDGNWRAVKDDELAIRGSKLLGKRVAEVASRISPGE
jgi:multimeric flavodoxin WrbA